MPQPELTVGAGAAIAAAGETPAEHVPGRLERWRQSDIWWSLKHSPLALSAAIIILLIVLAALAAPLFAVQNPFDPRQLNLMDAQLPPLWQEDGKLPYLLGTDNQGRDLLSALLHGSRISLLIGGATVVVSLSAGVLVGLVPGIWAAASMGY